MNNVFTLTFFFLFIFSFDLYSKNNTSHKNSFAHSNTWLKFLFYHQNFMGKYYSKLDGEEAFIHKNGKKDPLAELEASIDLLENNPEKKIGKLSQTAWCSFVARRELLLKYNLISPKIIICDDFLFWKNSLQSDEARIIFASYYPGNPASIFGHTFLKLGLKGNPHDFFNYGLDFSASTGDDGGIPFAVFGLTGVYQGHFSLIPYHLKLKEYNFLEHRDLWEYKLNLSKEQIDEILTRIWEIESSGHFDYYFLDENCSYQILALIESVNPNFNLVNQMGFFVLPLETVKIAKNEGLIDEMDFKIRESKYSIFLKKLERFTDKKDKDRLIFKLKNLELIKHDDLLINKYNNVLYSFLDYQSIKEKDLKEKEFFNNQLLELNKAKIKLNKDNTDVIDYKNNPLFGHAPRGGSIGADLKNNTALFSIYYGLHDLMDPQIGYPKYSKLKYFNIEGQISKNNMVNLNQFDIFKVLSLNSFDSFEKKISFETNLGITRFSKQNFKINPEIYFGIGNEVSTNFMIAMLVGPSTYEYLINEILIFESKIILFKSFNTNAINANFVLNNNQFIKQLDYSYFINSKYTFLLNWIESRSENQIKINLRRYF